MQGSGQIQAWLMVDLCTFRDACTVATDPCLAVSLSFRTYEHHASRQQIDTRIDM